MATTHIEASRTNHPDYTVTAYCGRIVEKHIDRTGEGPERITYLPHTRHFVVPPDNDSRTLCKTCVKALAPPPLHAEQEKRAY